MNLFTYSYWGFSETIFKISRNIWRKLLSSRLPSAFIALLSSILLKIMTMFSSSAGFRVCRNISSPCKAQREWHQTRAAGDSCSSCWRWLMGRPLTPAVMWPRPHLMTSCTWRCSFVFMTWWVHHHQSPGLSSWINLWGFFFFHYFLCTVKSHIPTSAWRLICCNECW